MGPPVPAIPPPAFAPVSAATSELQKMKKKASSKESPKALEHKLEPALDVLPTDIELTVFLKSPQLQHAWLLKLQNEGEDKAKIFKEVIIFMQSNPDQIPEIEKNCWPTKKRK